MRVKWVRGGGLGEDGLEKDDRGKEGVEKDDESKVG